MSRNSVHRLLKRTPAPAVLLDLDGTLVRGGRAVDGAVALVRALGARCAVELRLVEFDPAGARAIDRPVLASNNGGRLAVRGTDTHRPVPAASLYRATFEAPEAPAPDSVAVGIAAIEARAESFAARLWRQFAGAFIRETGF